jgi:hypothetical protein
MNACEEECERGYRGREGLVMKQEEIYGTGGMRNFLRETLHNRGEWLPLYKLEICLSSFSILLLLLSKMCFIECKRQYACMPSLLILPVISFKITPAQFDKRKENTRGGIGNECGKKEIVFGCLKVINGFKYKMVNTNRKKLKHQYT